MNNEEFRNNIRVIGPLALVELDDVITAFEALSNHCGVYEQNILDYFETNYIGELRRGRRRRPLFPHGLQNVNQRVASDLPKTNNMLEGWHRQLNGSFVVANPTIWTFLKVRRTDAAVQQVHAAHYHAGQPPPKHRRLYQSVNGRIRALVADYQNRPVLDFLRGVAYNLSS